MSRRVVLGLVVLLVVAASVVSACGGGATEPVESEEQPVSIDGETLLQDRCTECHSVSRVTNASKSSDEWEDTVVRMIAHGANLNDEEQAALIDYLAQTYGP
jgi:hypothetical protein